MSLEEHHSLLGPGLRHALCSSRRFTRSQKTIHFTLPVPISAKWLPTPGYYRDVTFCQHLSSSYCLSFLQLSTLAAADRSHTHCWQWFQSFHITRGDRLGLDKETPTELPKTSSSSRQRAKDGIEGTEQDDNRGWVLQRYLD